LRDRRLPTATSEHVTPTVSESRNELLAGALGTAAAVWLLCFTGPGFLESIDYQFFHRPHFQFLLDSLKQGELPLWNPYIGLGRPFVADMQSGVFYPPVYLLLLGEKAGMFLLLWAHVFFAAWGMRRLTGEMGVSSPVGWAAGGAFVLAGTQVSHLFAGHLFYFTANCYIPWIFLHARQLDDGWDKSVAARHALLMGLQLVGGHPQVCWLTGIGQGVFLIARNVGGPGWEGLRRALRSLAGLAAVSVGALALAAVVLLPFFELAQLGNRGVTTDTFINYGNQHWSQLKSLVLETGVASQRAHEFNWFLGPALLGLGLAGLTRFRDRDARGLAAVAMVAVLLALGDQTPIYPLFKALVPGFASFRLHARAGLLVSFAIVVAAAMWMDRKQPGERGQWPAIIALLVAGFAVSVRNIAAQAWLPAASILVLIGVAGWQTGNPDSRKRSLARACAGILVFAHLLGSALQGRREYSHAGFFQKPAVFPEHDALLAAIKSTPREDAAPPRIAFPWQAVPPNHGMLHRYSDCNAYTALFLQRPWDCLHTLAQVRPSDFSRAELSLDIFAASPFPFAAVAQQFGFDSTNRTVLVQTNAGPRAWVAHSSTGPLTYAEVLLRLQHGHDQHRSPLVEDELAPALSASPTDISPATIRAFGPNEIHVDISPERDGLLVLAEAWHPGWMAEVNGTIVEAIPANGWMRAFPVSAGQQKVRVFYEQNLLWQGCAITALSLGAIVWFGFLRKSAPRTEG
jgi:hypothetical protein